MLRSLVAAGCIARPPPPARLSRQLLLTAAQPRAAALYRATIESVRDIAGTDIRLLRLKAHEALDEGVGAAAASARHEPFKYAAGQWVDFHIPGVDAVGGYSIISAPSPMPETIAGALDSPQLPFFELAVKKARHAPAAWLHSAACAPGCAVAVRAGGSFTLLPALRGDPARSGLAAAPRILLVAGGVGINPLYSMLLQLAATGGRLSSPDAPDCSGSGSGGSSSSISTPASTPQPHVTLLWSVRTLHDAFLLPQLRALASSVGAGGSPLAGRLRLVLTLTRQNVVDAAACDGGSAPLLRSGRISPELLRSVLQNSADGSEQQRALDSVPNSSPSASRQSGSQHAFVCGPPAMTEHMLGMLQATCGFKGEGVDLHVERWW